jgi:hypothetical protein
MYSGIGQSIDALYKFGKWYLLFSLPLSIWKIVDIAIWVFKNVRVDFGS